LAKSIAAQQVNILYDNARSWLNRRAKIEADLNQCREEGRLIMKSTPPVRIKSLNVALLAVIVVALSALSSNAVSQANCTPPASGLVSWWRAEGNTLDQVGGDNGTLVGNTTYGAGEVGQGFVFDGNGDTVRVGFPASLQLQNFTFETWIRRADPSIVTHYANGAAMLLGAGSGGYQFAIINNGTIWVADRTRTVSLPVQALLIPIGTM
jgi:hypothetical protein